MSPKPPAKKPRLGAAFLENAVAQTSNAFTRRT